MSNETSARVEGESGAQIFLDCDGVLADFDSYAEKIFGLPPRKAEEKLGAKRFWCDLQSHEGFYRNLPLMPDARELFDAVAHLNPIILTGLPLGDWAEPQKREWGAKHFPHTTMICCMSADKRNHMKPGDILIDDFLKYKSLWVEAGGIFIHHTSTRASLAELKKLGILGESGLSEEQAVKQKYPNAYIAWTGHIFSDKKMIQTSCNLFLGFSWADARARIEAKPEPLPNTLGVSIEGVRECVICACKWFEARSSECPACAYNRSLDERSAPNTSQEVCVCGHEREAHFDFGCGCETERDVSCECKEFRLAAPNTLQEELPELPERWDYRQDELGLFMKVIPNGEFVRWHRYSDLRALLVAEMAENKLLKAESVAPPSLPKQLDEDFYCIECKGELEDGLCPACSNLGEGTAESPLRAPGTIKEIAERVRCGQWTTLDLDALTEHILAKESAEDAWKRGQEALLDMYSPSVSMFLKPIAYVAPPVTAEEG